MDCGIGGGKSQNVLWQAHNLSSVKNVKNVVILCGKNNLHLDTHKDIVDDIIEIGPTCKRLYININIFICGIQLVIIAGR